MIDNAELDRVEALYNALAAKAEDGIFRGSKTTVYKDTRMSMKHYPRLFRILNDMGCIEQIQRGNAHTPTVIKLIHAPSEEAYKAVADVVMLTPSDSLDTIRAKLRTLEERIPPIDLSRTLVSLDSRISDIESWIEQQGR